MRTKRQPAGSAVSAFRRLPMALAVAGAMSQAAIAGTVFTVSNNLAIGPGSLYQAILDANANCSIDPAPIIQFSGPFVIGQSVSLPQFLCGGPSAYTPTIDGYTNTGGTANTDPLGWNASIAITVDGSSNFSTYGCAIDFQDFGGYGGSLTVKGLQVRNFNYGGGPTGICGRMNVTGSALRNNGSGLFAESGSVIGGDTPQDRNLVSGNGYDGVGFDANTTIKNNLIGIDFDSYGGVFASPNNYGVDWCGCNTPSGTIANNVIVASNTGIWAGGTLNISGNKIGTDPSGTTVLYGGIDGIYLSSPSGTSISDNVIAGWAYGIDLYFGNAVSITGNKVGVNAAGTVALANQTGINDAYSYGTQISGNVVSGNTDTGIYLYNTNNVLISQNLIGLDANGSTQIGNYWGIYIGLVASNNTIDNNYISGNFTGIFSSDANFTTFSNNHIGTTPGGSAMGNGFGFVAECGTNLSILSNIIAASAYGGMLMNGVQNSVLASNTIGGPFGNSGGPGLSMDSITCSGGLAVRAPGAKAITLGANNDSSDNQFISNSISNNTGGGINNRGGSGNSFFQNSISGNNGDGLRIDGIYGSDPYGGTIVLSAAIGNSLQENLIWGNAGKNVNLAYDGAPLPNDAGDADTNKPNNWQNYPVLADAVFNSQNNVTTISFSLDSKAGDYRIDFFANDMPGAPAGQYFVGSGSISLASDGTQSGSYAASGRRLNVSAIATRVGPEKPAVMDSSELSLQVAGTDLPIPGVSVVPSSINFGDVVVGRSSGSSTVTVQSTGTADYVVGSLREDSCTGLPICSTGAFSCSTTCADGSKWTAPNSCVITASFTPTVLGAQSKTLALCDNAAGSPRMITFSGNGVLPAEVDIAYSPATWSFGEVLVGAQSPIKSFTLTNSGTNTVYLGPATTTDDFLVVGGTCGAQLAGGANCSTEVQFAPLARGGVNGVVQIVGSNTPPASVAAARAKVTTPSTTTASALLQGSGAQFGELRLPAAIPFGTMVLNGEPRQQSLQLTNTGNGPLAIGSITIGGPFTMNNGCGPSLAVGASCNVALTFTPSTLGNANGTLNVITDAPGGSRAIALTASVIADARPVVRISPSQLGFGNRQIGTQSTPQPVTIRNEGAQTATLGPMIITQPENGGSGAAAKSEFSISGTTCGATLEPQATCVASIVFRALGFGTRQGELSVSSNSADSPQKATMAGTGCRPYAAGANRSGRDPCAP